MSAALYFLQHSSIMGSEAAQWNAYCSVIKAQKSYQKACITEGLCLIKDHNEWSFQSQIKTQDLSSIDGCLLIFLWFDIELCSETLIDTL